MLTFVTFLLIFIEILTCLLLIGVVLLQRTRGHGMGAAFGAGMGEALFGAQMGNVLTRTTVVLAVVFLVTTTLLAMLGAAARESSSIADSVVSEMPVMPAQAPVQDMAIPGDNATAPAADVMMPPVPDAGMVEVPMMAPAEQPVVIPTAPVVEENVQPAPVTE